MQKLEKTLLLEVYENLLKNHSYEHTIKLNSLDATTLVNYRDAFRNLESQGFLLLHFDNESLRRDALSCLRYPCEITPKGIKVAVTEKQA